MTEQLDFKRVIRSAWAEFDDRHEIMEIVDVSANVSTNHVYKIFFFEREPVFAKVSDYGKYEYFREDHIIINNLANNIETPYVSFLAHSLTRKNEVFIYRYHQDSGSAWIVFYNPIRIRNRLPRRLDEKLIKTLGRELAGFHKACLNVSSQLPNVSKTTVTDIHALVRKVETLPATDAEKELIRRHAEIFLNEADKLNYISEIEKIPVFVDWNIGNFSVTADGKLYSRWDYDWFRVSSRVMDFYFFSRVVSDIGDRTVFSYLIDPLNEPRFLLFLQEYHQAFPLSEIEIRFIREAYRFFILNYVIKDGYYFFRPSYAQKLQQEAYSHYLPSIERFNVETILKALKV